MPLYLNLFDCLYRDVEAINEVQIVAFNFHTDKLGCCARVLLYTKVGSYVGHETNETDWTLVIDDTDVVGEGQGNPTSLLLDTPVVIPAGRKQAFYLTINNNNDILSTPGTSEGALYVSDNNLEVYEGIAVSYPFGANGGPLSPRIWNGEIVYADPQATDIPSASPSLSSAPSSFECQSGEKMVVVKILTDQWPSETSWELTDSNGNVALSVELGDYNNDDNGETLYTYVECLVEGESYDFTIDDSWGDGIWYVEKTWASLCDSVC